MRLFSNTLVDRQPIPDKHVFGLPHAQQHVHWGQNISPHLTWDGLPKGTRSLVMICHDPDVPSKPDDVNQEGREVPETLPRVNFYHWVLVDLSPEMKELREAEFSQGVTPHGKNGPHAPGHARQGINDFTGWFSGDPAMQGYYYGYDGPLPPWNDSIPHRYIFTLYATDLERCPVEGAFTGQAVQQAMEGHVLDQAALLVTYSLNPRLRV